MNINEKIYEVKRNYEKKIDDILEEMYKKDGIVPKEIKVYVYDNGNIDISKAGEIKSHIVITYE